MSESNTNANTNNVTPRSKRASVILTPEKKLTALMLRAVIFAGAITWKGLNQLVNVYLVAIVGWTPLTASYLWMIMEVVRIVCGALVGDFIDRVKIHKYTILVTVAVLKIVSGVCMMYSTAFGVMVFKSIIDGIVDVSFLPTATAMTLGVVGKTRFHSKVVAWNNIVEMLGLSVGVAIFGFVSYATWPDVNKSFALFIASGLSMLVCIFFMLKDTDGDTRSDVVDHRLARGRSVIISRVSRLQSARNLQDAIELDSDDEGDDEKDILMVKRRALQQEQASSHAPDEEEDTQADAEPSASASMGGLGYTQVMTYRQMYADPKRRRSLIFLSLVIFTFHLANSSTAPLLGQYMAINTVDPRSGLPIMTGLILTNTLSKAATNWALSNDRAAKIGYNKVLLIGSAALCTRLILISAFVNYFDNFWALGATQVLDGIGGGSVGLMVQLCSHLLSRRTGHFNLNMSIMTTWNYLGGMLGHILGSAIATEKSYEVAFPVLACFSILPGLLSFGISMPDLKRID